MLAPPVTLHTHVRAFRERAHLRPSELARQVGISRQALHKIETGAYLPSTLIAFQLAQVLHCRVDELFTLVPPEVTATLCAPVTGDTRVQLAQVGERLLAFPLTGTPGFRQTADGVVRPIAGEQAEPGEVRAELLGSPDRLPRTAVLVGCDPSLELLSSHAAEHAPEVRVLWHPASSLAALEALSRGEAHAAAIHLWDAETGVSNLPFVERLFPGQVMHLLTLWSWEQGLILPSGNPRGVTGIADLPGLRLVNREVGAGSRLLLDAWLGREGVTLAERRALPGYGNEVHSHLEAAGRVAAGLADVAPGPRSAAQALGLHFIPVQIERFDLVVPDAHLFHPGITALLAVAQTPAFRSDLALLGGYDPGHAGERWQTTGPTSPPPQEVAS
ncbi:XRE family transcriptional regulator of molybdate metabolism [Deinococcus phoenicis]|uniref:XRE family transcriptional regulator of molybdate metabolism n=1 Tax=Deinococcus phoenicis TaxID=1476583 RepID=A0A016QKU2_9DEIO|nr:substrate-binding domain-containing protein [Deinococcus phoenicis]EYB66576.1 XRE family transcriptional regulator of molybdate metabolism [Deinococcus phoenicis]